MFDPLNPTDHRRHAPAADRNRDAIWAKLKDIIPENADVLEIASGTGQHVAYFAPKSSDVTWWPSDPDPDLRNSIVGWTHYIPNIQPPLALDMLAEQWWAGADVPASVNTVYLANLLHISPWQVTEQVLCGAAQLVPEGGNFVTYGPFRQRSNPLSEGNAAFDTSLRDRNELWGLRSVENIDAIAQTYGWGHLQRIAMPANNLMLVWQRC